MSAPRDLDGCAAASTFATFRVGPSLSVRMACTANAIFPQLELIQSLSREFERGPMSVSCTVQLTRVAQATGYTHRLAQIRGGLFRLPSPSRCDRLRTARSHLASLLPVT